MVKHQTILQSFFDRVTKLGDAHVALAAIRGDQWREWTWSEYGERVCSTACAMAEMGFRAGDKVAILAANCPEWLWVDMAAMCLGGAGAGIYPSDLRDQVEYITEHSEARFLFVDSLEQLAKTDSFRSDMDSLTAVVVFHVDEAQLPDDPKVISYDAFLERGRARMESDPGWVEGVARAVEPASFGMMVYTSGTTGRPKGAMYSHRNIIFEAEVIADELGSEGSTTISFLPLCHIAERLQGELVAIYSGNTVKFARSIDTLREDLVTVRPSLLVVVPRLWEKFYAAIRVRQSQMTGVAAWLFGQTLAVGAKVRDLRNRGEAVTGLLAWQWSVLDRLVAQKLKIGLGLDRCVAFASGAAPLSAEISAYFGALGIDIREVYGQTESVGVLTANPEGGVRPGTVGKALPGVELRISEQGEVLARGDLVFLGYYKSPEATAEAIDSQGWLHTGDVGEICDEGYLRITDRLKDIIVTAGGKNVAPQNIENLLKAYPGISQVVVIGDKKPYLVALVTLDESDLERLTEGLPDAGQSVAELATSPAVIERIQGYVDEVNTRLARYETIKYFEMLPRDLSIEEEEITPTLKVKRRVVQRKHAPLIESMYEGVRGT